MQKVNVKRHSVPKLEWKQMDRWSRLHFSALFMRSSTGLTILFFQRWYRSSQPRFSTVKTSVFVKHALYGDHTPQRGTAISKDRYSDVGVRIGLELVGLEFRVRDRVSRFRVRVRWYTGCLQIQPKKFPGDFQDTFNKFPVDFLHWSSLLSITIICTKIGTDVKTPKSKNKFVGVHHWNTPFPILHTKPPF